MAKPSFLKKYDQIKIYNRDDRTHYKAVVGFEESGACHQPANLETWQVDHALGSLWNLILRVRTPCIILY